MPRELDRVDLKIMQILEDNARIADAALADRSGVTEPECRERLAWLQHSGHIGGYSIIRNYPNAKLRPIFATIRIVQDPARTGHDLQRSMDFIKEITTAETLDIDNSVLIRVQTPDIDRLHEITDLFRMQSAVQSIEVSTTKPLLIRRPSLHDTDR